MSRAKEEEIMIFRVLPGGTIVSPEYGTPSTRQEAFALGGNEFQSAGRLDAEANDLQPLMWELQRQYREYHQKKLNEFETNDEIEAYKEEWPEHADEVLAGNWVLQLPDVEFEELRTQMEAWAKTEPNRLQELDYFRVPADGQEFAMEFFQEGLGFQVSCELGIEIVEGSHPGSSHAAAELIFYSVEEANNRAEEEDIPIRFEAAEE